MARQWIIRQQAEFETSLEFEEDIPVPSPNELGPNEVLVRIKAASLNYRELQIPKASLQRRPYTY